MKQQKPKRERADKIVSFRLPLSIFDRYERMCIEEQIKMSEMLQQAVNRELKKRGCQIQPDRIT